jgi:DNA-binding transcriptional LysR family regulator
VIASPQRDVLPVLGLWAWTEVAPLGFVDGDVVGPLITELHNRHPGITATVREMTQDSIEIQLLADELDLGIAFDQPHLPGVTATPLFAETLVGVVGTTTPTEPLTAQAIAHHPLALLTPDFATRGHIDAYFAEHRVTPRIAMETNSIQALTEIVRHTALATVLPDAITHQHPHLSPPRSTRPSPPAPSPCSPARGPTKPPPTGHSPTSPTNTSEHTCPTIGNMSPNPTRGTG